MSDLNIEFQNIYGEELTQRMWEAVFLHHEGGPSEVDGFYFFEHDYQDAINSTGYLSFIDKREDEILVSFTNGNIGGSTIEDFGPNASHERPPIVRRRFIPARHIIGEKREFANKILSFWLQNDTHLVKTKQDNMNYDLHFSPTYKIRKYYEDFAAKFSMEIETFEVDRI